MLLFKVSKCTEYIFVVYVIHFFVLALMKENVLLIRNVFEESVTFFFLMDRLARTRCISDDVVFV